MLGRKRVVQNRIVARHMERFFDGLAPQRPATPEAVARAYCRALWRTKAKGLVDEKKLSRSRFYVGLSVGDGKQSLANITKRSALVTDTLLLSHHWAGDYHEIGVQERYATQHHVSSTPDVMGWFQDTYAVAVDQERNNETTTYGINCPSLEELGQWVLDAEPLLRAGLAWYLPSYSLSSYSTVDGEKLPPKEPPEQLAATDYLLEDGRAVDASGAEPIKSQLVRPILSIDLPVIDGVSLDDFSRITVSEFDSYSGFRDFLRQRLLEMDDAMNAVQSDRETVKLGLHINDQIRAVRAEMTKICRKRAVTVTGAVLGSASAILVAVYGPALQQAIAAIGASGGVWGIVHAVTENNRRALRTDKWYYVWALAEAADKADKRQDPGER